AGTVQHADLAAREEPAPQPLEVVEVVAGCVCQCGHVSPVHEHVRVGAHDREVKVSFHGTGCGTRWSPRRTRALPGTASSWTWNGCRCTSSTRRWSSSWSWSWSSSWRSSTTPRPGRRPPYPSRLRGRRGRSRRRRTCERGLRGGDGAADRTGSLV